MQQTFNQEEINKFAITSTCVMYSILEDYCSSMSLLTHEAKDAIKDRILKRADANLQKLREVITPVVDSSYV